MNNKEELFLKVEEALAQIRPYLLADGGDIKLIEVTNDYDVIVNLIGACECCPFSMFTLKMGVEQTIKQEVPQIRSVVVKRE